MERDGGRERRERKREKWGERERMLILQHCPFLYDQSLIAGTFMFQLTREKKCRGFYGSGQEVACIASSCMHFVKPSMHYSIRGSWDV
jgi:hypothetical protein